MKKSGLALLVVLCMWSVGGFSSAAEKYPTKPITFALNVATGGVSDITCRLIAEKFRAVLGQPVLVANKPGAGGIIGLKYVLGQEADGYTVLGGTLGDTLVNPYFQGTEPIKVEELAIIGAYLQQDRGFFTTPDKPFKTFMEFIQYAKKHPGELSVGSPGNQWSEEIAKSIAVKDGLKLKYVRFASGGEATTAIMGRHVDLMSMGSATAFQAARDGKLVVLANLGAGTLPFFPNVQRIKDLGYKYLDMTHYSLALRAGTPEHIRKILEDALRTVVEMPDFKKKMTDMGLPPSFVDGKTYAKIVSDQLESVPELLKYNKAVQE